ncbi:hypothetical protein CC2G_013895 [Coprinopsis cinerea AmutBmut pab1-1]|nr:hypothetical protein CC2G_013895 [Coprinopsis cinerea AmutBmut pab1-1]
MRRLLSGRKDPFVKENLLHKWGDLAVALQRNRNIVATLHWRPRVRQLFLKKNASLQHSGREGASRPSRTMFPTLLLATVPKRFRRWQPWGDGLTIWADWMGTCVASKPALRDLPPSTIGWNDG